MHDLAVCWHEAGHALVAHLCGRIVTGVSATPGEHFGGVTLITAGGSTSLPTYGLPMILQPADLRREVETSVTIYLAGEAAEHVYFEHRTRTALVDAAAAHPGRPVAIRTPEQDRDLRETFEDADRPDVVEDHAAAWRTVRTLTAVPDLARATVDLCEQQALTLLRARVPMLHRIATALHRHGDLSGADLLDLIGDHDANQAS